MIKCFMSYKVYSNNYGSSFAFLRLRNTLDVVATAFEIICCLSKWNVHNINSSDPILIIVEFLWVTMRMWSVVYFPSQKHQIRVAHLMLRRYHSESVMSWKIKKIIHMVPELRNTFCSNQSWLHPTNFNSISYQKLITWYSPPPNEKLFACAWTWAFISCSTTQAEGFVGSS